MRYGSYAMLQRRMIPFSHDVIEEERLVDEYEAVLMSRIDDNVLRKIFSGLIKQ